VGSVLVASIVVLPLLLYRSGKTEQAVTSVPAPAEADEEFSVRGHAQAVQEARRDVS
jgi:hypothetical protein